MGVTGLKPRRRQACAPSGGLGGILCPSLLQHLEATCILRRVAHPIFKARNALWRLFRDTTSIVLTLLPPI